MQLKAYSSNPVVFVCPRSGKLVSK